MTAAMVSGMPDGCGVTAPFNEKHDLVGPPWQTSLPATKLLPIRMDTEDMRSGCWLPECLPKQEASSRLWQLAAGPCSLGAG